MNKTHKQLILFLSFIILIFLFTPVISGEDTQNEEEIKIWEITEVNSSGKPSTGNQAPDFSFRNNEKDEIKLSDLQGKIIFINFWASWCPPCKQEMPDIQNIYEKYEDKDEIMILTVNIQEEEKVIKNYMSDNDFTFPVLKDMNSLAQSYYVSNIPTSFFLDKEGIIREKHTGVMTEEMIENAINKAGGN
ncbi:MAG: TlpA family protein disulfide reductase [Bacillota bacterium]